MPSSSSARRRSERVRGEMPSSERSSSQKRERPSARSRMTSRVHLPHTISAVLQTGQVSRSTIGTAEFSAMLYELKRVCAAGAAELRSGDVAKLLRFGERLQLLE